MDARREVRHSATTGDVLRRLSWRWRAWSLVAGAIAVMLSLAPSTTAANAATAGQTTFTITGTVKGTLSAPDTPCSQQTVSAQGATFMLTGTLKGSPATQWTIQLYAPRAGTWKNFGQESGNGPNVSLLGSEANGTSNWNWTSTKKNGSMTTTKTSGKVSITLGPYSSYRGKAGKGKVHVTGSWGCTS
jgi:hypothetical protein